jgi:hypothetical protein
VREHSADVKRIRFSRTNPVKSYFETVHSFRGKCH